ncbi:MAG: hypothetical protein AB7I30_11150 [Isosphaeraceae bacterium]
MPVRRPGAKFTVGMMVAVVVMGLALNVGMFLTTGDFFWDEALSRLVGHETRYAAGYSERQWAGLRRGMTMTHRPIMGLMSHFGGCGRGIM